MSFAWKGFHSFGGGFSPSFGPSLTGGVTPIGSWDASTSTLAQLAALVSHSRTSLATMFDSTGKLTYAPNNLALNTATLGTQTVTVQSGVSYILSIKGTGSVTLTGASTAGPLNGTGASNRVDLKITAATSSLTLTVSGSVTSARLSAVTYETAFRSGDDVDTTASAYYGPRIDYDPNTLAVKGLLIEEARTNLVVNSNQFTSWTISGGSSVATNSNTQIDGTTNGNTFSLVAGSTGHQIYKSYTGTAAAYTNSVYAKAGTSSWLGMWFASTAQADGAFFNLSNGTIGTIAAGTTAAIQSIGNGWYRCSITKTLTAATYYNGLEVHTADNQAYNFSAAGTESLYLFGAQGELGSFATSYIPTAAASVTRAADVVQFTGAALTALQGSAGSAITETISLSGTSPASITNLIRGTNSILYRDTTGKTGTTNGTTALLTAAAPTWNAALRNGLAWSGAGRSLVFTGGAVATDANAVSNGGTLYLGSNNGSAVENGWYQSFAIYNQRLPDATLQAKSVVGATY